MKRLLLYLVIFTACCWANWYALTNLTTPIDDQGQYNTPAIIAFFVLVWGGTTLSITLALSILKIILPNPKLPPLIVKDSLLQGTLIGSWVTGLLMLQFFRVATPLNLTLWLGIFLAIEWIVRDMRKVKVIEGKKRTEEK